MPDHGLEEGDVGAVVHIYGKDAAYEVEFVTAAGKTIAVVTVGQDDIRPMAATEILHVRELAKTA
jgi:putative heme iron utilization protein